jgi:hypothetical protein
VLEMAVPIQSQVKCEVRCRTVSQCKGLTSSGNSQIFAVYCDIMNWQHVMKWCHEFSEGKTDVHDEQRSGRPSLISDDLQ